ncbi:glycerophosphodiester phosphodiesterase family protein [Mucilaginibacter corticis]|uniref:Glycerophosphodiester phosphodiesterase family protein n=1 Tax=Mucilaginibacter corticis TaxID=2597670 RepID=A0A556M7P0_9SPHI|nr:glycerophosphodiester phosphodiesterase family protein [Mucilaginibacter corticis]TSJ35928.1 glycerophosphodiester phosphodiesterase family protein [Mucilaginibacter corticis]
MKKIQVFLLLVFAGYASFAQNKIMVTAHRGDWRNAPENSLLGFTYAAKMGVDMVELDLKKTKDGELVIMHDATINRTTDGKGEPADYTLAELKTFHLKNGLGRVSNNPIPTLKEVMLALKGKPVKVNLDKSYPFYRETYALLKQTGTLEQAVFKAEVPFDSLKQKYPELIGKITYMPVVNLDKPGAKKTITDYLAHMKLYAVELTFSKDTSDILAHNEFIRQTGAKVWINSLWASLNGGHDDDLAVEENNKKDSWDWIIAHHATIIQTDRPQLLLRYLKQKHLHQ